MAFRVTILALTMIVLVAGGCSFSPEKNRESRQRLAIERWERCVNREADRLDQSRSMLKEGAGMVCEGYRRDVLDTYPPHLTPRINDLLIDRTEDRLASNITRRVGGLL